MTPVFPAQRAAEEFDGVLEGRATTAVAERYAAMAATVQVLRDQPEVLPRAEFVVDLRERLMLAAETEMVPAAPVVRRLPSKSRRNRRLSTVAASLVIVGGSAGMAAAASGSLPGEALYPIKRGVEQVQIAAHFGDASKGSALLGQADTRLDEVQQLLSSGKPDPTLVSSTVADFRSSANAGADKLFHAYQSDADTSDITTVRDFTSSAMDQVSSMATGADPATTGALRDTADALADIDQQASTFCATCGGAALTPPASLAAAAGAPSVANLIARPVTQARADIALAHAAQVAASKTKLEGLQGSAQGAADKLAKTPQAGGSTTSVTGPLTSTVTASGKVIPNLTSDTASTVKNLVGGLTGTASSVTGGGGGGGSGGNAVSGAVKGAGSTVDGTVDGVTGAVKGTVDGLTKALTPKN